MLLATVLLAALAAAPVSAQRTSRLHLGLTVTSMHGHVWENTMAGAYGGVSFDVRDYLRLGVLYVQKGRVWDRAYSIEGRVHSAESPMDSTPLTRSRSKSMPTAITTRHGRPI